MVSAATHPVRTKAGVLRQLPPLPRVAAQLMRLVSMDEISFREISELIRTEAAVSAEVLRLANSPLVSSRRKITGILHALSMVGLERIRALVVAVALKDFLSSALHATARRCWRHNLACALVCEELSMLCFLGRDASFTAGLLHDVGRLALLAGYPVEYSQMLESAEREGADVLARERELFEMDHCEAGRWLIEEWRLPAEFRDIAGRHHQEPDRGNFNKTALVQLGCRIADALGFAVVERTAACKLDQLLAELPPAARRKIRSEEELAIAVACKINAVECSLC